MRPTLFLFLLIAGATTGRSAVVQFDLSPPGASSAVGLHPLNEVIPGFSNGSGNEVGAGIFFDTSTRLLTLNLAYGSAFGFTDLTGPAFSWLLHGPSPNAESAPVLFNLQSFHTFAVNPSRGGQISGSLTLSHDQESGLLAGLNYINIYTPANLGGELRGQLVVVPEPRSLLLFGAVTSASLWFGVVRRRQQTLAG